MTFNLEASDSERTWSQRIASTLLRTSVQVAGHAFEGQKILNEAKREIAPYIDTEKKIYLQKTTINRWRSSIPVEDYDFSTLNVVNALSLPVIRTARGNADLFIPLKAGPLDLSDIMPELEHEIIIPENTYLHVSSRGSGLLEVAQMILNSPSSGERLPGEASLKLVTVEPNQKHSRITVNPQSEPLSFKAKV